MCTNQAKSGGESGYLCSIWSCFSPRTGVTLSQRPWNQLWTRVMKPKALSCSLQMPSWVLLQYSTPDVLMQQKHLRRPSRCHLHSSHICWCFTAHWPQKYRVCVCVQKMICLKIHVQYLKNAANVASCRLSSWWQLTLSICRQQQQLYWHNLSWQKAFTAGQ